MESGRRTDDRPWVRNARKTVQWTVFSGERAAAPEESSSVLRSSEKEQAPQCGVATIEDAEARRRDSIKKLRHMAELIWNPGEEPMTAGGGNLIGSEVIRNKRS